jgi:hypothetical protein
MLAYFRGRLREYYAGDVDELRRCWSDPDVTFETAMPPDRTERLRTDWFVFRSPVRRRTADFYRVFSECVEDCVIAWAEAVKRATDGEALFGAPLASVLDHGLYHTLQGHLRKNSFARAAASPHVDMLESPASYSLRDLGRGDTTAMVPVGSLRLAGKIWLRDFDTRTSLTAHPDGKRRVYALWRTPDDPWQDVQILKRDTAYSLLKGGSFWWHEIDHNMYRLPEHVRTVKRLHAVGRGIVHADRSLVPGLGVFVDPESGLHQAGSNRLAYAMNYEARRLHWTHSGMACETFLADDAAHTDMPPHPLVMVTSGFCLTDRQVDALVALARRSNGTIVWLMAPGLQTPRGFDLDRVSRITGFRIRAADVEGLPRVTMVPGRHPWSRVTWPEERPANSFGGGLLDADDMGGRGVGPLFYADLPRERNAEVLGLLDVLGEPGLVTRRRKGYTSVYCSAPYVHNALLRRIGRDSGAHIYVDNDDAIHAARELLLVNARRAGPRTFRWPRKAQVVVDLYTGRTVAENTQSWTARLKKYETRFYYAGTTARFEQVRNAFRRSDSPSTIHHSHLLGDRGPDPG